MQIASKLMVAAILVHHCSVMGALVGWGWNNQGQLGAGTTESAYLPKLVMEKAELGESRVVSIAVGFFHTLALTEDGQVWSWGLSDKGQLGTGTTERSLTPQRISTAEAWGGRKIVAIAAGEKHSAALTDDGEVFSWGDNAYGQAGDGTGGGHKLRPVAIDRSGALNGKTITRITAGLAHTVALDTDGKLYVWGAYGPWRSSAWSTTVSQVPVPVEMGPLAGKTISDVASGFGFNLALTSEGEMFAWGSNEFGKLGDGSDSDRMVPGLVPMSGPPDTMRVTAISVGWHHALALTASGKVFVWGYGYNGQLGFPQSSLFGPMISRARPEHLEFGNQPGGERIRALAAGALHSVAVSEQGRVFTWGYNQSGEAGVGTWWRIQYTPVCLPATGVLCGAQAKLLARGCGTIHVLTVTETSTNGVPCFSRLEPDARLLFAGDPLLDYEVQVTSSLTAPIEWTPLEVVPADVNGVVTFQRPSPLATSFWRVVPVKVPSAPLPDSAF